MKFEIKHRLLEQKKWLIKNGFKQPRLSRLANYSYWVSRCGRIASAINPCLSLRKTPKILKQRLCKNGYLTVSINGKNILSHRMIASEYISDIKGKVVHHKNGKRDDNRVSNLDVVNASVNNAESFKTRKLMYGQFINMCLEHFKRNNPEVVK